MSIVVILVTLSTLFGTWHLDLRESKFASGPPPYVRVTCKIEPLENDGLRVVYDMVGKRGGVTHWEWTGKPDGKDYPLEGVEEAITNAYTQTGERTFNIVFKVDGRTTTTSKVVISPDGSLMTVSSPGSTAIYKK